MGFVKRAAIRALLPLAWSGRPDRICTALNKFADVEADSAWQFLRAFQFVDDVQYRSELFGNALEEVDHSERFRKMASRFSTSFVRKSEARRLQIYDTKVGTTAFMAFHFVGENDVFNDFSTYAAACPDTMVAQLFRDIQGDEEEHKELAWRHLVVAAGSTSGAIWSIFLVRMRRTSQAIERGFNTICSFLFDFILIVLISFPVSLLKSQFNSQTQLRDYRERPPQ